jgi:excinuclease ABC subunit B
LERLDILSDLRSGKYDVVVGINLLREGLDLPEVSLVAILDADKEGFLRSRTSLIQTMGRAARHNEGIVIMYADEITDSMSKAIEEVNRRRDVQVLYNQKNNIIPVSITKPLRERIVEKIHEPVISLDPKEIIKGKYSDFVEVDINKVLQLVPSERSMLLKILTRQMLGAAKNMDFEIAAKIRDQVIEIKKLK